MKNNISEAMSKISHIHSVSADFLRQKLIANDFPDLVSSHGNILFQLSKQNEISMLDLAKRINRDKSTTTVLVRKLETLGFVKSKQSETDSRSKYILLTEKGQKYNESTKEISKELLATLYKDFTAEEKNILSELLDKIAKNFDEASTEFVRP